MNALVLAATSMVGSPQCHLESDVEPYLSLWNQTALRICTGEPRREHVCVIGGGVGGVHLAWLLKRRLFTNMTLFDQSARLGGDVWTRKAPPGGGADNVTRELGAAFLSPDYVEVRALLARFGQEELPLSTLSQLEFHSEHGGTETVQSAAEWALQRLSHYTNTTNATANAEAVQAALSRYVSLHRNIFGEYEGRFPPEPSSPDLLAMLNCSGLDFLTAHKLLVLEPLLYQFFVLQGMGLLYTMPAYYVLKWASPASLSAGGFGDRSNEPLAMLPEGYGAMVDALAADGALSVRLGWRATSIERRRAGGAVVHFTGQRPQHCDLIALSGPIPEFVAGSLDRSRPPILHPATAAERDIFGQMQPMQFLISLVELASEPNYETLEYWPDNFQTPSAVIVRRDVGFAESGQTHAIGGVQSFSAWPVPAANRSTHWAAQRTWAAKHGLEFRRVLAQNYIDTYLFHHTAQEIAGPARKAWRIEGMQLADGLCNCTLYVGGAASFEAVEDVMQHNLQLVSELFDTAIPLTPPAPPASPPVHREPPAAFVLEQLCTTLPCGEVDRFIAADDQVWTPFLRMTPGYVRKAVRTRRVDLNHELSDLCEVWDDVEWFSRELWKAIPASELAATQSAFIAAFGSTLPEPQPLPGGGAGLNILLRVPRREAFAAGQVAEDLVFHGIACGEGTAKFVTADNATFSSFLAAQPGFIAKEVLASPPNVTGNQSNCTVWSRIRWRDATSYKAVCAPGAGAQACAQVHSDFVAMLGFDPPMQRMPMTDYMRDDEAPYGPRLAVLSGIDVVAYHSLTIGEHDVRGSPAHRRWLNSSVVLPPDLRHIHPRPYEFWFSSEGHAQAFEVDPFRYLPAFGGHCTHGIASRGDLNETLLADGRVAFTCVNGSRWVVLNGTLYMNSCSMWADFEKQPMEDIAAARGSWHSWFGGWFGPINDACVQDAAAWDGDPVGALIPPKCVLN